MVQTLMEILHISENEAWQMSEVRYYEILGIHNLKVMRQENASKTKQPTNDNELQG